MSRKTSKSVQVVDRSPVTIGQVDAHDPYARIPPDADYTPEDMVIQTVDPNDASAGDDFDDVQDQQTVALNNILSEAMRDTEADSKVVVYRSDENNKQGGVWLFECSPQEFHQNGKAKIQERYGAGRYEVRVYGNRMNATTGVRRYGIMGRYIHLIGEPLQPKTAAAVGAAPEINAVQLLINEQRQFMQQFMQQVLPVIAGRPVVPAAPAPDPVETFGRMFALFKSLQPAAPVAPVAAVDPLDGVTKMFSLMRTMREMMPERESGGAGGNEFIEGLKVVKEFLPMFKEAMGQLPNQATPAAPPQLTAIPGNADNPPPAADPALTPQQEEEEMFKLVITREVKKLIVAAKNNDSVDEHAEKIAAYLTDEQIDEIMARTDWIEILAAYDPEVKAFPQWFNALRTRIDELTTDNETAENPGNTAP